MVDPVTSAIASGRIPRLTEESPALISRAQAGASAARGVTAGLVLPFVDTMVMSAHLAKISRSVANGAHGLLNLDCAGWYGSNDLVIPDNLSLLTLPPDSPELNPVENVWQYLRANWLAVSVFDSYDAIVDACCSARNRFANNPVTVTSITTRSWAQVN